MRKVDDEEKKKKDSLKLKLLFLIQKFFNPAPEYSEKIDAVDITLSMSVIYFSLIIRGSKRLF